MKYMHDKKTRTGHDKEPRFSIAELEKAIRDTGDGKIDLNAPEIDLADDKEVDMDELMALL